MLSLAMAMEMKHQTCMAIRNSLRRHISATHGWNVTINKYCKSLKYGMNVIQRNYGTALDSVI